MNTGERGADLVSRLMTFARRRPVEPEEIVVSGLLDDISSLLRTAISRRVALSWIGARPVCDRSATVEDAPSMDNATRREIAVRSRLEICRAAR